MKKIYLSFITVLSVCQFTYAQWTTNSANTVTSTPNSVGIGTTPPSTDLDIRGLIQISGNNMLSPPPGLSYGLFPYGGVGLGLFSGATSTNQGIEIWTNPNGPEYHINTIIQRLQ